MFRKHCMFCSLKDALEHARVNAKYMLSSPSTACTNSKRNWSKIAFLIKLILLLQMMFNFLLIMSLHCFDIFSYVYCIKWASNCTCHISTHPGFHLEHYLRILQTIVTWNKIYLVTSAVCIICNILHVKPAALIIMRLILHALLDVGKHFSLSP